MQRESGPDSIDLVPGLYSLAQQWLADVAAQRFQELRHPDASLDQWFKSRRVMQHLQVCTDFLVLGTSKASLKTAASSKARRDT